MEKQMQDLLLAVLSNNEILMGQVRESNVKNQIDNHALDNMEKIYNAVYQKIKNSPDEITQVDCKFLDLAVNITLTSLTRQERTIQTTINIYKTLKDILMKAAETPEELANFLKLTNIFDVPETEVAAETTTNVLDESNT